MIKEEHETRAGHRLTLVSNSGDPLGGKPAEIDVERVSCLFNLRTFVTLATDAIRQDLGPDPQFPFHVGEYEIREVNGHLEIAKWALKRVA